MNTIVPHFILDQFAQGRYRGQFQAAAAYVDISGFTPLTETLFHYRQDGAEILGETLGTIFGPLVSAVYRAGGLIPLFAGDAFTAIFPAAVHNDPAALQRAWQTANAVQVYLMPAGKPRQFQTAYGTFGISVKVGLASGDVQWGIVGEDGQRTYYFRGSAITASAMAQMRAVPGQIAADDRLQHYLSDRPWTTADPPVPSPIYDDRLDSFLADFVPQDILTLPSQAEFRHVCPVFISVEVPIETAVLEQFILDVLRLTRHYGGYLSQVEFGDKGVVLLLYFGAPISHENNVLRAARCLSKLAELRQSAARPHPRWRAGLTHGLVWAGFRGGVERREYGIMGDVVNSAARIAQEAGWGEIWLDEQAARQLAGEFDCRLIGERFLKGRQAAKTLYRLLGHQAKINLTYQGRMIGRRQELDTLQQTIAPIFSGRFAGVSFIYGEAGMGKSRLLFELQQEIGDVATRLYCPADEVLRQSLNPFRHYLHNYFHNASGSTTLDREQFARVMEQVIGRLNNLADDRATELAAELQRTQSCLAALLNIHWPASLCEQLEPRLRYDNTLAALTTFIQAQALFRPVILQLEDLHWFDPDSRQLLEVLSQKLADYPAVLILTSRFAADGSQPTIPLPPEVPQMTIQLEMLDRTGVRALAEQLLGGPIHSDLLGFLVEKSDGRPFFVEQLVLELSHQAAIEQQGGQYGLLPEKAGTIPTTLNTLLVSRLDNLPLPVKQVVQTAAILGERFLAPVLKAMLAQDRPLPDMLHTAVQQRIWVSEDELRYIFKHALLRDAAYEMQPQSHRRELHRLAALNLELFHAAHPAPFCGEIAHHYERAYTQGLAEMRQPAIRYLTLAAERAIANYENEAAIEYVNRALAILPEGAHESRFNLLLLREKVHSLQAALEPWRADLEALAALTGWSMNGRTPAVSPAPLSDTARQAKVVRQTVLFTYHQGEYRQAELYARQGRALYRMAGDSFGEGRCLALQGAMFWELGRFDRVKDCLSEALDIFRKLKEWADVAGCLNTLGITAADQGKYMEAWGYYNEALPLVENRDLGQSISTLNNLGEVSCWLGLYEQAQQYIEQGLRLARQNGNRQRQTMLLLNLSFITLDRSDWQLGQHYLNRSLKICREIGNRREEGTVLHNLGYAAVLEGDLEAADAYFEQALSIRQQLGSRHFMAEDRAALAWVAHMRGSRERAGRYLRDVTAYLSENPAMFSAYKPLSVYWRSYLVARERDGRLAQELLAAAQTIIQERAALIPDPAFRQAYLTNVPENRSLMNEKW